MKVLKTGLFGFFLMVSMPALASSPPAELPEDVYLKTPTQSFNSRFYYFVEKGKIWFKANRQTTQKNEPWQLMGCEGLPCQPDNPAFEVPQSIVQISADGDELTAIDGRGYFYARTSKGPGLFSKDEWIMHHGFPKDTLRLDPPLDAKRAMAMGRRHSDVLWHEDPDQNVHHFGTMGTSTIYLLGPRGHEIYYTDNGLPTDFSNQICGPERGTFVAENLQVSAGTLFVINRSGEMYTHMNDFDLNGGTSMFIDYTYVPQAYRPNEKGDDFQTHLTPWRLPLEDWQKQPTVPLSGKARLSTLITILQTGQGNAARELRVGGLNSDGETGYWHKGLTEKQWRFSPARLEIGAHHWAEPEKISPRVTSADIVYQGNGVINNSKERVELELLDFNLFCSPATLRLKYKQKTFELKLHTIDAWINVHRKLPGLDGTPKLLLGTLDIPENVRQDLPEPYRSLHHETFHFQIAATTDFVYLFSRNGEIGLLGRKSDIPNSLKSVDYNREIPLGTFAAAYFRDNHEHYIRLEDPSLLIWDLDRLSAADLPRLETLIEKNRIRLREYNHGLELIMQSEQAAWLETMVTGLLRDFYMLVGAPYWLPYAHAVATTAPEITWSYYAINDSLNQWHKIRYRKMIIQISHRLERYEQRKKELLASQ